MHRCARKKKESESNKQFRMGSKIERKTKEKKERKSKEEREASPASLAILFGWGLEASSQFPGDPNNSTEHSQEKRIEEEGLGIRSEAKTIA